MKNIPILTMMALGAIAAAQVDPGRYKVEDLGEINTIWSEFGAAFYDKDHIVFAAPREGVSVIRTRWEGNGQPFLDLFVGSIGGDGKILDKQRVPGNVNRKYHEGTVAFTKDKRSVYFSANDYDRKKKSKLTGRPLNQVQLYRAAISEDGTWGDIERLPFNMDGYSTGHPALNRDGSVLYFVSDRPGSMGATDIYAVDIDGDGRYGEPRNLGSTINTKGREMFPFISDGDVLYFSSDGHDGDSADLDVYASKVYGDMITVPMNLGPPINSAKDDFAFIIDDQRQKGYLSSNRDTGRGDDDIYRFTALEPIRFEAFQTISGTFYDEETKKPLDQGTLALLDADGNEIDRVQIGADGSYSYRAPINTLFVLRATAPGYLGKELKVKTVNTLDAPPLNQDVELTPDLVVKRGKVLVNIKAIYFDYDKWDIRPDAAIELDKVVRVMKKYPLMKIESGSFTDARGSARYNQRLSEKRALATVEYIVSQGIAAERISGKGYGETDPVNGCVDGTKCSEQEYQANRRTEFKVVSPAAEGILKKNAEKKGP